ncbi:hypothetical protein EBZ38_06785 [bacterium]|nr:hypothetical protein [bacterium]
MLIPQDLWDYIFSYAFFSPPNWTPLLTYYQSIFGHLSFDQLLWFQYTEEVCRSFTLFTYHQVRSGADFVFTGKAGFDEEDARLWWTVTLTLSVPTASGQGLSVLLPFDNVILFSYDTGIMANAFRGGNIYQSYLSTTLKHNTSKMLEFVGAFIQQWQYVEPDIRQLVVPPLDVVVARAYVAMDWCRTLKRLALYAENNFNSVPSIPSACSFVSIRRHFPKTYAPLRFVLLTHLMYGDHVTFWDYNAMHTFFGDDEWRMIRAEAEVISAENNQVEEVEEV